MSEHNDRPGLPPGSPMPNWQFGTPDTDETPAVSATSTPPADQTAPPPFEPAPVSPRSSRRGGTAALVVGGVAVAAVLGATLGHELWPQTSTTAAQAIPAPSSGSSSIPIFGSGSAPSDSDGGTTNGTSSSAAVKAVAAKVSPALVDINTNLGYQSASAAGTGIVLTSDGTVLTNNHVIAGATKISATGVGNGKTYTATVVGYDRSHDIAVIKLSDASGLTVASFGNSRNVAVGRSVIGIGNAGGRGGAPSTAAGTVTALNQSITASDESNGTSEQLTGLIQTNAPIQPGDSGGALVTTDGLVIGVDTAASSSFSFSTGDSEGYAVPSNQALAIAHQIMSHRSSPTIHLGATGFLGVEVSTSSAGSLQDPLSGGMSGGDTSGVSVSGTLSGSPAAKAGLVQGDTIVAVNGSAVSSPEELTTLLGRYHPGDSVTLTWQDASGQSHSASVTLAVGPAA